MLQGLYAASSGMEASQTQFDAISNDLANLNTPGYQSQEVGFSDLLYSGGGSSTGSSVATGSGAVATVIGRSQEPGAIDQTGDPLDVAISGDGYLQVRRNDGSIGLTRDGALQVDSSGQLTNQDGNALVPPITLPKGVGAGQVTIAANGEVTTAGRKLGRITLVTVPAPDQLQPDGDSMFSVTSGSGATRAAAGATVQQGALEGSNVDLAQAMSTMVTAERAYQMAGQAIQYQDQMLEIANGIKK
ncbi:MAG: flagellar hook-basal body protein [Solirubrobacteraceae bacterium]